MKDSLTLAEFRAALRRHQEDQVVLVLPDGRRVPAEFHVTEAGTVTKDFIDCGGTRRRRVTAQLQTWIGRDAEHRLKASRLAHILDTCAPVLPSGETGVEFEYEDAMVSQYPLVAVESADGELRLQLGLRHTDCLARAQCDVASAEAVGSGCGCGATCC